MLWIEFLLLVSSLVNIVLSLKIWLRSPKNPKNIFYSLANLGVVLWGISETGIFFSSSASGVFLFAVMTYIAGAFIAINILLFSFYFPFVVKPVKKLAVFLSYSLFICLSVYISIPGNIVVNALTNTSFNSFTANLTGSMVYTLYFLFTFGLACKNLVGKFFKTDGFAKSQIYYISIGVGVALLVSFFTNIVMPIFRGTLYGWIGPLSTLVTAYLATYLLYFSKNK